MGTNKHFFQTYVDLASKINDLVVLPRQYSGSADVVVHDVEIYRDYLIKKLPCFSNYPRLASEFAFFDTRGYLGIFKIDEALELCAQYERTETELLERIERVRASSANINPVILDELEKKATSWRRQMSIVTIHVIRRMLSAIAVEVDEIYESLSAEEKLGRELEQSERERKRLLEQEEARRRGATQQELDKEAARRRAMEGFNRKLRRRKK